MEINVLSHVIVPCLYFCLCKFVQVVFCQQYVGSLRNDIQHMTSKFSSEALLSRQHSVENHQPARRGLWVTTGLNKAHGTSLVFLYLELSHMATFNYKRDWDRKFWYVSWGEWIFWKTVVCVTDDMAQICSFTTLCVWQAQGLSTGRLYCDVLKQRDGLVFDDSQCGALSQCLQQTLWSLSYGTSEDLGKIAQNLII